MVIRIPIPPDASCSPIFRVSGESSKQPIYPTPEFLCSHTETKSLDSPRGTHCAPSDYCRHSLSRGSLASLSNFFVHILKSKVFSLSLTSLTAAATLCAGASRPKATSAGDARDMPTSMASSTLLSSVLIAMGIPPTSTGLVHGDNSAVRSSSFCFIRIYRKTPCSAGGWAVVDIWCSNERGGGKERGLMGFLHIYRNCYAVFLESAGNKFEPRLGWNNQYTFVLTSPRYRPTLSVASQQATRSLRPPSAHLGANHNQSSTSAGLARGGRRFHGVSCKKSTPSITMFSYVPIVCATS